MDALTLVLILLIIFATYLIYKQFSQKIAVKPSAVKKDEIIEEYKQKLEQIKTNYKDDESKLKIEKMKFIKQVNTELSMNLFFDEHEAKKIIQDLLK
ncbi:hypothetical protein [Arcobacter roscoffensis]|uniref:Uncharacterized protein n=1 Tax=Arcobacter roscoffensis TaxID=2961520 RepID=A0ABY5E7M7_9BACT|nr:hypothetical protein [Arcobacter roscoffensis]UTJ07662.1 hypothetical protein NJU99_06095 [Arcobacter roscoffensis]